MKKLVSILAITIMIFFCGCSESVIQNENEQNEATINNAAPVPTEIAASIGITTENYPKIDGSTSTLQLVQEIYKAMFTSNNTQKELEGLPKTASKTMTSYEMLINNEVDLILVPDPSKDVQDLAEKSGVELEYIPIGAEALVFITHKDNPAEQITSEQVKKIYSEMSITNWSDVGGIEGRIVPICRNADSGSQAQMDSRVLNGVQINPVIESNFMERDMNGMIQMVEEYDYFSKEGEENAFALGYSLYYYISITSSVMGELYIKTLMFDGVSPNTETILSKEYPLATNYFAVIRKDTPKEHSARKIAAWLTGSEGQWHVAIAGLGALKPLY